ncbi:MerR family DNA-binding transcriptional regulator [Fictibacillus fluitans]|uniref:MerR family DNA-binding transcriptional regulator n=1 Tax=Fictibacillus fluitans TaxID=3058422 RepID=A0ABT8I074_9BACL|nr:MerR family transcriptional regulator [Fictibacillus sp. NE201]MDN4526439.1 MerR family DNA-binding transcriptional regulator [Fictibacillus sp. NE201]
MGHLRPVDIARQLKISTSTIRGYEERGFVPPTERTESGYRVYTEEHVAYFECIVAMSPAFGMDLTRRVLLDIQKKDIHGALWRVNKAQVENHHVKTTLEQIGSLLIDIQDRSTVDRTFRVGEVAEKTGVSNSTLRYWETEGYISSARGEENNYRYFDLFQYSKILLMKAIQNGVYSEETIKIKRAIKELREKDPQGVKEIIQDIEQFLNHTNLLQLQGLSCLHQLCKNLKLY